MAFFKCLLRGEGFRGVIADRSDLAGFYVNRHVEANDAESARVAVLARFGEELAALGWADKGGRVAVDEMEEVGAADLPGIGLGFVWFPEANASGAAGETEVQPPFLLLGAGAFSVSSQSTSERWSLTTSAIRSGEFRGALCLDREGAVHAIVDVIPERAPTRVDRLVPWRSLPVRLVLESRPEVSLADVRDRLVEMLENDSRIADFLKVPAAEAIVRVKASRTPSELIVAASALV
jgi:hypothetical protein